jgi:hypothetical protein
MAACEALCPVEDQEEMALMLLDFQQRLDHIDNEVMIILAL